MTIPDSGAVSFAARNLRVIADCPEAVRSKQSLIREILGYFTPQTRVIVQLRSWNEFSLDGGLVSLLQAFRQQHAELRSLKDAPVHVFGHEEMDLCIGVLDLALAFDWEVVWLPEQEPFLIWAYLDGQLILSCDDGSSFRRITAAMSSTGTRFTDF